jgi:PPK2 family polyphosphate:nucleotide phosphotransferase
VASDCHEEARLAERRGREDLVDRLRVEPGSKVDLAALDCDATHGWAKVHATAELDRQRDRLADLQDRLWAEEKHPLLVVLQGIDTSGKGGTIKHVMEAFNPQGCRVASFKVPTELERSHDYLWRIHRQTPARGEVVIFDRSHYEEVLIVRVNDLVPREVWRRRYRHINEWERMLTEEGTVIVKFFLAIDAEEQRQRLQARFDDPTKRWKFRLGDLTERKRWDDYRAAFEEALERTSTSWAPWYVIPANRKWFRNLAVAQILGDVIESLSPAYPPSPDDLPERLIVE